MFTPESLARIAGVVISLIFFYTPAKKWLDSKTEDVKRLWMLFWLAAVTAAIVGISCSPYAEFFKVTVACTPEGIIGAANVFVQSLVNATVANQITYLIAPRMLKG